MPVLNRRAFLRAAGVGIALPLLDAMNPISVIGAERPLSSAPRRMVLISNPLGLYVPTFFPAETGKDYKPTRYLAALAEHRQQFTVFSGMSHRGYPATHDTQYALLTGAPADHVRLGDVRNSISLDQEIASRVGGDTRFPCLSLGGGLNLQGGALSWDKHGVMIPSEGKATAVFKQLFLDGTPQEIAHAVERLRIGHSILDGVRDQARTLAGALGPGDRQRLDMMLTSIREAERQLHQEESWIQKPKPKVGVKPYSDDFQNDLQTLNREKQWYDLVHLALQTDSTRVIALWLWSYGRIDLTGVNIGHHDATHHGQDESKIKQLSAIEEAEMKLFGEFLSNLKQTNEHGRGMLDDTIVFYGSNMGNGSAHTCDNLPIILAGGGFKHAGHVAFDRHDNKELSNLFVRMGQQMGLEMERFGSSTGVLGEI